MQQPSMPSQTRPWRAPGRRRFGWALHVGGRFTPLETWSGNGQITASNGGRYVLSATLRGGIIGTDSRPDCDMRSGCDTLHGSAKMCTESGKTYSFTLSGAVHSWLSTNGAKTSG